MRLAASWAPLLMAVLISLLMVLIITAALSLMSGYPSVADWLRAFVRVWPIAFVALLAVLPLVRRVVAAMIQPPASVCGDKDSAAARSVRSGAPGSDA
jgi:cadmium resistance protein CadD (predicted permease)